MEQTALPKGRIVIPTVILNLSTSVELIVRLLNRLISSLLLVTALIVPTAILSSPKPQAVQVRIYDRNHRDYHNWDDREDRAYRRYLVQQHRSYREYQRQNSRFQRNYWSWRHRHPDRD